VASAVTGSIHLTASGHGGEIEGSGERSAGVQENTFSDDR